MGATNVAHLVDRGDGLRWFVAAVEPGDAVVGVALAVAEPPGAVEDPDVLDVGVLGDRDVDAGGAGRGGQPDAVVVADVPAGGLHQQRREPGEVAVDGRVPRVVRIDPAGGQQRRRELLDELATDVVAVADRVVERRGVQGDVGPQRVEHPAGGQRQAGVAGVGHQRDGHRATGRIAGDGDALGCEPAGSDEVPVDRERVLVGGREREPGRQAVVGRHHPGAGAERQAGRAPPGPLGQAAGVPAAVEVEDHEPVVGRPTRRHRPLDGHAGELVGLDRHARRARR